MDVSEVKQSGPTHSQEMRLMHLCARVEMTDDVAAQSAELIPEIDWMLFLHLVEAHRVLPLVYYSLQRQGFSVPQAAADELRRRYFLNVQTCLRLARDLAGIAELFTSNGMDIMPFKGPALAQEIYPDISMRQTGDLDILVRIRDLERASKVLISAGYTTPVMLDGAESGAVHVGHSIESDRTQHFEFFNDKGTIVELHKGVGLSYLPFGLNNDQMWALAEPIQLFGRQMYGLPPIYELLLLIHHGTKHGWYCLSWVCDTAEFIRTHQDLDWSALFRTAKQYRMEMMTKVAMKLAADMLQSELPETVSQLISHPRVRALSLFVQEMHRTILEPHSYDRYEFAYNCRVCDRTAELVRYVFLRSVTPSLKEWTLVALPKRLAPLYRVIRPLRIAGELAGQVARKLSHRP